MKLIRYLTTIPLVILLFLVFTFFATPTAEAHGNSVDWSSCGSNERNTAVAIYDADYSSYSGYVGQVVSARIRLEVRDCLGGGASETGFKITAASGFDNQFTGWYSMGALGSQGGAVKDITVSFKIQSGDNGDSERHCITWEGLAQYSRGGSYYSDGVDTFCFTVYNSGYPPPPPPTYQGTIGIAKYKTGDPQGKFPIKPPEVNNAEVSVGWDAPYGFKGSPQNWNSGGTVSNSAEFTVWVNSQDSTSNTSNSDMPYYAQVQVPPGWKVVRATNRGATVNPVGGCKGGTTCRVENVKVTNGGITWVDFMFEPETGALGIVKYPQNGADIKHLTATAYDFRDNRPALFGLTDSQQKETKDKLTPSYHYSVQLNPDNRRIKITRIRINRGNETICDNDPARPEIGSCGINNNNLSGIEVVSNQTTWVDVFFEPLVEGGITKACAKPSSSSQYGDNGKIMGYARDLSRPDQPAQVRIRIDQLKALQLKKPDLEYITTITANQSHQGPPGSTGSYGFSVDIPDKYFDGQSHSFSVHLVQTTNSGETTLPVVTSYSFSCPGPTGVVQCLTDGGRNYIQGWAFDPRKPGGPSHVAFRYDNAPDNNNDNIFGTIKFNAQEIANRQNEGYRGVDANGLYVFKETVPDNLHDGQTHTLKVNHMTVSGTNPQLGSTVSSGGSDIQLGPNIPCGSGSIEKWFWPWLQTQNGNVVASGKITGQPSGGNLLGSRLPANPDKEAEYMVISVAGGGGPFCSTYQYILTNTNASPAGDCGNGNGYNVLNKYKLVDEHGQDTVLKAIADAFKANGAGNSTDGANTKCAPYNTFTALPVGAINTATGSVASNNCLNGTIFKHPAGSLGELKIVAGRMTVYVDGSVTINRNITYQYTGYSDPKAVPNLAIIVKGDVNIDPSVTNLDAVVYASGRINTCSAYNPTDARSTASCNMQLTVNGGLVGKDGIYFGRSFYDVNTRTPAELINMTAQTIAFPPPGLDSSYFGNFDNSVRIDSGEYQPRF